jgi:hypothetical protein
MKFYLFVISVLFCATTNAQTLKDADQRFETAQLQADWDTLYVQLQNNHPDLYAQWPKKEADAAFKNLRKELNRPLKLAEFDLLARKFLAGFQDGHTYVDTDFESGTFVEYGKRGGKLFPLGVTLIDGRIYCADVSFTSAAIPMGAEIISINDRSANEIVQTLTSLQSADDLRSNFVTTQRLFGFSLWHTYGWGQHCKVTYRYKGKRQTIEVVGISTDNYMKLIFGKGQVYQLHVYPEFHLAILQINSYTNFKAARSFIDSSFQIIKEQGIKHVALDLRKNGGGNSVIGNMVLDYINREPYEDISSKTWLDGPLMQAVSPDNWRYSTMKEVRKSWQQVAPNRYYKKFSPEQPDSLLRPDLYTTAKFYLLTSGRTYSSAHMTAISVKCGKLGTIIGQPTGERLDLTGEIIEFKLPQTHLAIVVPTALYTTACGNGKQVGVQPDYFVPLRVADIIAGRDAELEFLKKLIQKENRAVASK